MADIGEEKETRRYETIPQTEPIHEPSPTPVPDRELEPA